jgi:signal transduction histidine kinase
MLFDFKIGPKGIEFVIEVDPDMPLFIYSDYNRLKQILINLLSNSMKYT